MEESSPNDTRLHQLDNHDIKKTKEEANEESDKNLIIALERINKTL